MKKVHSAMICHKWVRLPVLFACWTLQGLCHWLAEFLLLVWRSWRPAKVLCELCWLWMDGILVTVCCFQPSNWCMPVWFLHGVSIACYAEPCISYGRDVCQSVCPSVTHWHWVKTTQGRITKSSPVDSPRTLVFGI